MATKRKALSKRTRFEIFKRDRFTCQYCGRKPPVVVLEVDHVVPVSKGGDNSKINLVTSCFDCNRGKSDVDLDKVLDIQIQAIEDGKEKLAQLRAMQRLAKKEAAYEAECVEIVYEGITPPMTKHEERTIKGFLKRLPVSEVREAMEITAETEKPFRYFCGICWRKISRGDQ